MITSTLPSTPPNKILHCPSSAAASSVFSKALRHGLQRGETRGAPNHTGQDVLPRGGLTSATQRPAGPHPATRTKHDDDLESVHGSMLKESDRPMVPMCQLFGC